MKSKEEIKQWLLENCVDDNDNLCINDLDFSDFEGDVFLRGWKIKRSLYHCDQTVGGCLYQNYQIVGGSLYQGHQTVGGTLWQYAQQVEGAFYSQKPKDDEKWKDKGFCVVRLKPITEEELEQMGYKLKEKDEKTN